ncbi:MAG: T9SS type A sorting domain-containing protein [Saprospiraceae bacterium]|nr:T9SS type A sorting domain-containing protein [Saprospiraceae bacterium]
MKKFILPILLFTTFYSHGQWTSFYFDPQIVQQPCLADSTKLINAYENFDIYQTVDNDVNGQRDTSCLSLVEGDLPFKSLDPSRPVFIRFNKKGDFGDSLLLSNALYSIRYTFNTNEGGFLNPDDCKQGGCSKLVVVTREKWLATGQDTLRKTEFYGNIIHNQCIFQDEICFPTSKWDSIYLTDWWWEVYLNPLAPANARLSYDGAWGYPQDFVSKVDELLPITKPVINNAVEILPYHMVPQSFGSNYLVLHSKSGIPSPQNRDDKVVTLSPNPATVVDITLKLNYESFYFQEYTAFVPSLVEGSDTLHHHFTILQEGGDMCLEVIDVRMGSGTKYLYKSGNIDFADKTACIFFKKGASFEIADGSHLFYGYKSMGMLGLADANVKIGAGASLVFDGTLVLNSDFAAGSVMELAPNARLIFGNHASVMAAGRANEKVRVKASPWQIDWGTLSLEEKDHFILEGNDIPDYETHYFYPNPTSNEMYFFARQSGQKYTLSDLTGKVLMQGSCGLESLDLSHLHPGIYLIQVGDKSEKLIKL